jgi:lipopolysaccharide export system protein LptA
VSFLSHFSQRTLVVALGALICAPSAWAEKADRKKPMDIRAGEYSGDNRVKSLDLRKGVTITQGTMKIIGDTGEVRGEPPTAQAKLFGAPVCFQQKKDGSNEYMRGQADRVEYDQRTERVDFFGKVTVHDGPNEMRGDHVVYNMSTEKFEVREKVGTQVRIVIVPKEKADAEEEKQAAAAAKDTAKPRLKTAKEIEMGRHEPLASKCVKEAL